MREHLLGDRDFGTRAAVRHAMKNMQALGVEIDELQGQTERIAHAEFSEIADARIDRIERKAAGAIGFVDAHEAEECVRRISKDEQIGALGHVAVVVGPLRLHCAGVQRQRRRYRLLRVPAGEGDAFERRDDATRPLAHRCFFSPSVARASAAVATDAPMRSTISRARLTSAPLLAGTPRSSQMLSSSPTRTLPPSRAACATNGICIRPMAKPAQLAFGGRWLRMASIVSVVASAPQGMPRQS